MRTGAASGRRFVSCTTRQSIALICFATSHLLTTACHRPDRSASSYCGGVPVGWGQKPSEYDYELALFNRVYVKDDGDISWNGVPVSRATFKRYVAESAGMLNPAPSIWLTYGKQVDCDAIRTVRKELERAYCPSGHCRYYQLAEPVGAHENNRP